MSSCKRKLSLRNVRLSRIWNKECPTKMSHTSTVVPRNTVFDQQRCRIQVRCQQAKSTIRVSTSTWFKNRREVVRSSLEERWGLLKEVNKYPSMGFVAKRSELENVNKAVYSWFVAKRSQQVPIDGICG